MVDPTGKVLDTTVIYPTAPQNKVAEAKAVLKKLIAKYHITLISLGNGTASRESEQIIVDLLKELPVKVQYIIVNEAGRVSSISASKLATEEFPNFDVGQRSAASMARRLQDPLAELVKSIRSPSVWDSISHDMNQKKLGRSTWRRGRGLREQSRRGFEYCIGIASGIRLRHQQDAGKKYCGISGGKRQIHIPCRTFEGAEAGTEGV